MKKRGKGILMFLVICFLFLVLIPVILASDWDDFGAEALPYVKNSVVSVAGELKLGSDIGVNLFTGSAGYFYPIKTPPGTNNLQPKLSLSYNSHNTKQNSITGDGWSLSQNYIQRNTNYTFNNISDDKFELFLDGSFYELIYLPSKNRYYTKIESFLYIKNKTGGNNTKDQYWIVKLKDGTTYRFGYNNHSELVSNLHDYTVKWNLDLINDTYNNSIYYTYQENPYADDNGTVYLDKIEYNNDKKRKIDFIYETSNRPDIWTIFKQGNKIKQSRRLKEINITADNQIVRKYVFEYKTLESEFNTLSFLSNITEYGNDESTTLPVTRFSYKKVDIGFKNKDSWAAPECFIEHHGEDEGIRLADVNGDGLTDVLYGEEDTLGNCNSTHKKAWINNGTGFKRDDSWIAPDCFVKYQGQDKGIRLADVNGDGLTDVLYGKSDSLDNCNSTHKKAWINNGTGWEQDSSWEPPDCFVTNNGEDQGIRLIDVNGDNLIDVLYGLSDSEGLCNPNNKEAWINNGTGWIRDDSWEPPGCFVTNNRKDEGRRLADVNGDGLTDVLFGMTNINGDCNAGTHRKAWINNATGWINNDSWIAPDCFINNSRRDLGIRLADVNGDSLIDVLYGKSDTNGLCASGTRKKAWINNASKSYLLMNITTQFGGIIKIDYIKSTNLDNTGNDSLNDLGFNLWVVANITRDNGITGNHSTISTIIYNYSGGLYNPQNKEFRGFNYVEEKLENKKTKHYFHQNTGDKGKKYKTIISDLNNNNYSKKEFTWNTTQQNSYYLTLLLEESEYFYDAQTTAKIKNISYQYDEFGNIIKIHYKGDITNANDDKYEYYNYLNNSDLWIVDKIKNYTLYDSDDSTKVKETLYTYDNLNHGQVPTKGSITSKEEWLNTGNNPITNYSYNTYGNLINQTNPNNQITQYLYGIRDPTYTYADQIINPKGHITNYDYDLGTGNLNWIIDSNSLTTNYTYDTFGRIEKEILPDDTLIYPTKEYEYVINGTAPNKIKITQRENPETSNTFDTYTFYDGFERIIQTKTEAENNKQIVTDIYYDNQSRILKQSNPYFINSFENYSTPNQSINTTNYTYDQLDRVIKIINPDNTKRNITYLHWNTTTYDENNNKKQIEKDAYNRIIEIREYNNNEVDIYITTYNYDANNNLIGIKDSLDNTFNFTYNTLSRKTSMNDPDLGTWTYSYDSVGNLINQTDNRNNITYLTYDKLNRIINKTSEKETINYTYDLIKNNTLSKIEINNLSINYTYDNRLRKIGEITIIDSISFITNYTYDSIDRITSEILPNNEIINYTYNNQGLLSEILGIINISYNEMGQVLNRSYGNGLVTNFTYNNENFRLLEIKTSTLQELDYAYDNIGNVKQINDTVNLREFSMSYDDLDRLIYTKITNYSENVDKTLNYSYNSIGNMMNISINNYEANITFYYNGAQVHAPSSMLEEFELADDTNKFYIKNSLGNKVAWLGNEGNIVLKGECVVSSDCSTPGDGSFIIRNSSLNYIAYINSTGDLCLISGDCSDSYSNCDSPGDGSFIIRNSSLDYVSYINSTGSLCLIGELYEDLDNVTKGERNHSYVYDLNGNLIQDRDNYYVYNGFNWLVKVKSGDSSGSVIAEYLYNQDGDRVRKIDYNDDGSNTTTYYIGNSFVQFTNTTGTYNQTYYYDNDKLIAENTSSNELVYYHPDHLGSTSLVTNSSGNVSEETWYLPFGSIVEGGDSRYSYTGKEEDDVGLMYYGARYYSTEMRHFSQADMLLPDVYDPQQLNRYSYVRNNPYKYVDEEGEWAVAVGGEVSMSVLGFGVSVSLSRGFAIDPRTYKQDVGFIGNFPNRLSREVDFGGGISANLFFLSNPKANRLSDLGGTSWQKEYGLYPGVGGGLSFPKGSSYPTEAKAGIGGGIVFGFSEMNTLTFSSRDVQDIIYRVYTRLFGGGEDKQVERERRSDEEQSSKETRKKRESTKKPGGVICVYEVPPPPNIR